MLFCFIFELNLKSIYIEFKLLYTCPSWDGQHFYIWKKSNNNKKNFMAPFKGWVSTASRLVSLQGGSLLFTTPLPDISGTSTAEGWKTESTLEPPSRFEHRTPGLEIQCLRGIEKLFWLALINVYLYTLLCNE